MRNGLIDSSTFRTPTIAATLMSCTCNPCSTLPSSWARTPQKAIAQRKAIQTQPNRISRQRRAISHAVFHSIFILPLSNPGVPSVWSERPRGGMTDRSAASNSTANPYYYYYYLLLLLGVATPSTVCIFNSGSKMIEAGGVRSIRAVHTYIPIYITIYGLYIYTGNTFPRRVVWQQHNGN